MRRLGLRITPHGDLLCETDNDAPGMDEAVALRLGAAFAQGSGLGLLRLGAGEIGQALPPLFLWWRGFAARFVTALCLQNTPTAAQGAARAPGAVVAEPDSESLLDLAHAAPMMMGAEYLTADVLRALWGAMSQALSASLRASPTSGVQSFLKALNPSWNLVGRVHFNLAENRRDAEAPFAFMATYTTQLSAQGKAQHLPLGRALEEYAGPANRAKLLSLLLPLQRAAETCAWLRPIVDSGEIFHPMRWSPGEAAALLASTAALESAGVVVRMPANWRANRPARPLVTATIGVKAPSKVGLDGLLDFSVAMTLNGEPLCDAEIATLLAGADGLALLRGQWVEIDRTLLERTMRHFEAAEALARAQGVSFREAMRMLADPGASGGAAAPALAEWSSVTAGSWLADTDTDS